MTVLLQAERNVLKQIAAAESKGKFFGFDYENPSINLLSFLLITKAVFPDVILPFGMLKVNKNVRISRQPINCTEIMIVAHAPEGAVFITCRGWIWYSRSQERVDENEGFVCQSALPWPYDSHNRPGAGSRPARHSCKMCPERSSPPAPAALKSKSPFPFRSLHTSPTA